MATERPSYTLSYSNACTWSPLYGIINKTERERDRVSAYSVYALLHCVVLALRHVAPFALKGSRESRE